MTRHAALPGAPGRRAVRRTSRRSAGSPRGGGAVAVRHRFTPEYVESTWTVTRGRRRLLAEALFPSWGGAAARIVAVLADGTTVELPARGRA